LSNTYFNIFCAGKQTFKPAGNAPTTGTFCPLPGDN